MSLLFIVIVDSSFAFTFPGNVPKVESYLNRCARVFVSVRSFTATNSISFEPNPDFIANFPILPKPFMPTFTAILLFSFFRDEVRFQLDINAQQILRRHIRRNRIYVESAAPFESRYLGQFRYYLYMPVIIVPLMAVYRGGM